MSSVGIALLLAACSSSSGGGGAGGQSSGSGGAQSSQGGSQSSGQGGSQSSGSGGTQGGGQGGIQSGSGGSQGSGAGGNSASGGSTGSGSGGAAKGGSSGSANGGSAGSSGAGNGGSAGGTSGGSGNGGSTGATGNGGSGAGGATAAGGSSGSTGSTPSGPAVYTSTNGSCVSGTGTTWTPGTIATSTGSATVTVNDSSASQTWEGFGGAFNEKGWQYLQMLSSGDRDRAMQLLFGTDGANFAIGRIPMGASDYAVIRYTCDEGGTDTSMANFNTTEDEKYIIPYIKAALAVKSDIKFWSSPWTPPTWMKTGPFTTNAESTTNTTTSNFDSGNMKDDAGNLTAYAQYFAKFVAAYKTAGINISMVAPQNEPNYALCYPSCLWTSALYTKFVGQYLGPALKDTGVSIMLGTLSNNNSGTDEAVATAALADSTAKGFFTVAGAQWSVLDDVNKGTKFGNLPIWATEHKCGNYPWGPSGYPAYNSTKAPNDQAYGVESWGYIRDAITKGNVTAYNAWNMVLDTVGAGNDTCRSWNQDALLTVDTSSKTLNATPAYCVFRHFSQFVAVGAKRVATSGGDAVAFKNPDGSLVAVMYNSGAANSSYVVSIGGQKLQFSMPANGWATVTYHQ